MLNIEPADTGNEKYTRRTQIRHGESLDALIEYASYALGVSKAAFIRSAIKKEAERVHNESARIVLTPEDAKVFFAALENPPPPTPYLIEAMRMYRESVTNAK